MDANWEARKEALLAECQLAPEVFERVLPRLEVFMEPFVQNLGPRTGRAGRRRACPRPFAFARDTSCAWKCSRTMARSCRTPGLPVTTKWVGRTGFAGVCANSASATCWPFPPIRRSAT